MNFIIGIGGSLQIRERTFNTKKECVLQFQYYYLRQELTACEKGIRSAHINQHIVEHRSLQGTY